MPIAKTKTNVNKSNKELQGALDFYSYFFKDLSDESKFGSEMLGQNVTTELAEFVKDTIKNPLKNSFEIFKLSSLNIAEMLNETTINFLSQHKNLIKLVAQPFKNNKLIYNIVLISDTATNRVVLLDYIEKFNNTNVSKHFKIVFSFVPPQFEKKIVGTIIKLK